MHASTIVFNICIFLFTFDILFSSLQEECVGTFVRTDISSVVDVEIVFEVSRFRDLPIEERMLFLV